MDTQTQTKAETETKAETQTLTGTELIEVSPAIHKLAERVRELTRDSQLNFYRFTIRVGLQRKIGDLIRLGDQAFLKASKRPGLKSEDFEALVGIRNRALKSLDELKAEVEVL